MVYWRQSRHKRRNDLSLRRPVVDRDKMKPRQWLGSRASAHRGKWSQLTPPGKIDEKLKSEDLQKSSFLNILRAIRAGRCRERCYADHIFIQIYFRMHHFVNCSQILKNFLRLRRQGGTDPLTKILRTPLVGISAFSLLQDRLSDSNHIRPVVIRRLPAEVPHNPGCVFKRRQDYYDIFLQ